MPATIRRSTQNSNVYRAFGIVSSDRYRDRDCSLPFPLPARERNRSAKVRAMPHCAMWTHLVTINRWRSRKLSRRGRPWVTPGKARELLQDFVARLHDGAVAEHFVPIGP
jgi:hypothetical protein